MAINHPLCIAGVFIVCPNNRSPTLFFPVAPASNLVPKHAHGWV